ncbi:copper homeostasis protein CutC [Nocardioides currus]|uniref:PF03932 family protein CutC n=1 Tax=Nocardioides currus TaxID=2133958 RepID=A0A2R7YTV4_9ACTN|nr:copper homeostasis protein CutC [Nocardioides currus]PUA79744.1 copper homeostasis protein CutC [Nocardioides currus]
MPPILVEICVDDVGGAAAARRGGADRVELCASLSEGGTTPTVGFVRHAAAEAGPMGLQVLVRPRGGYFVPTGAEVDVMLDDIAATRSALRDDARLGFTLGALTPSGDLDEAVLARLVAACGPRPVVFHKAFDTALAAGHDPQRLLDRLVDLGIDGVLTAGGDGPAVDHLDALSRLVRGAGQRLRVVVAGGVRPANVAAVLSSTGCREVHLRAPAEAASASTVGSAAYDAGSRTVTSEQVVADVVAAVGGQAQASGRSSSVQ